MAKPSTIKPMESVTDWVRLMVVAGSGWGKTPFGGTAERGIFLSCDPEGVTSAFTAGSTMDVWEIGSWEEWEDAYRYFRDGSGCDDYDTIVVDSLNELQNINKKAVLAAAVKGASGKRDPDILAQPDYQKNQINMTDTVKLFNKLPIHIVWNCQWKKEDDETDLGFRYEPLIQGQKGDLAEQIKGYMKIIGYGTRVDKKRANSEEIISVPRLIFQHQPPFMGRDRTGALGSHMDNPTVPKILAAVAAKMAEARRVASAGSAGRPLAGRPQPRKVAPVKKAGARKP